MCLILSTRRAWLSYFDISFQYENHFCLYSNAEKIVGYLNSNVLSHDLIPPHVNFSHLTTSDYAEMYQVIKTVKEGSFSQLGLDPCILEDELNKVSQNWSACASVAGSDFDSSS